VKRAGPRAEALKETRDGPSEKLGRVTDIWVSLLHVRRLDATGGAYIYGAARADGVVAAVAALALQADEMDLEPLAIEWLQTHESLPPRGQESEPVRAVVAALEDADVALDFAFSYPEDAEPDPADALKEHIDGFVEHWIDDAVERFGAFELGDYAFVAEMRLDPGDDQTEIGWAYQGSLTRAPELFTRAAEDAQDD
jgi:hypothetical protein